MSQLVIGVGSSHGPSIQNQPETWAKLAEKDVRDPRFNYQELLKSAKPGLDSEITIEVKRERYAAAHKGLAKLVDRIEDAEIDVFVVISNVHAVRPSEPQPVFGILRAEEFPAAEVTGAIRPMDRGPGTWQHERTAMQVPGHAPLANYLIDGLIQDGFDIACIDRLSEGAMLDEAFSFCYKWLFGGKTVPIVPFLLSRDLPNQATPARCIQLGRALRKQIEACPLNLRIGLVASGGLSHQVVDEELDHVVVDALTNGKFDVLGKLSRTQLNRGPGTPEILNWITVAAAMAPHNMDLIDYLPAYRSVAGTGHGLAFGTWTN
jgi:3-O-methylgallate 3,4-dioxygenase